MFYVKFILGVVFYFVHETVLQRKKRRSTELFLDTPLILITVWCITHLNGEDPLIVCNVSFNMHFSAVVSTCNVWLNTWSLTSFHVFKKCLSSHFGIFYTEMFWPRNWTENIFAVKRQCWSSSHAKWSSVRVTGAFLHMVRRIVWSLPF